MGRPKKTHEIIPPAGQQPAKPKLDTIAEAKKIIAAANQKRIDDCAKEIDATLKRYGCMVDIQFSFTGATGLKKGIVINIQ